MLFSVDTLCSFRPHPVLVPSVHIVRIIYNPPTPHIYYVVLGQNHVSFSSWSTHLCLCLICLFMYGEVHSFRLVRSLFLLYPFLFWLFLGFLDYAISYVVHEAPSVGRTLFENPPLVITWTCLCRRLSFYCTFIYHWTICKM